jgi:hypothetical protein
LEKRRDYIEWFKLYDGTIEQDITLDMNQGQAVDDKEDIARGIRAGDASADLIPAAAA